MSSAMGFKSFRREAKVLSKNMARKHLATITEVDNLIKTILPLALVLYQVTKYNRLSATRHAGYFSPRIQRVLVE